MQTERDGLHRYHILWPIGPLYVGSHLTGNRVEARPGNPQVG